MTDFIETSVSKGAERPYSKIASLADFKTVTESLMADTTMDLVKKDAGAASYRATIDILNPSGKKVATATLTAVDSDKFTAAKELLMASSFVEAAGGENATASHDVGKETWSQRFSCKRGDDTFSIVVQRDKTKINDYEEDTTLAAVEAWADTVSVITNA